MLPIATFPATTVHVYTTAYDEFPGLKSAVRVQECISVLGDNPVAKRLGNFALSSINAVGQGQDKSRGGSASSPPADAIVGTNSNSSGLKFPPLKASRSSYMLVLFLESIFLPPGIAEKQPLSRFVG